MTANQDDERLSSQSARQQNNNRDTKNERLEQFVKDNDQQQQYYRNYQSKSNSNPETTQSDAHRTSGRRKQTLARSFQQFAQAISQRILASLIFIVHLLLLTKTTSKGSIDDVATAADAVDKNFKNKSQVGGTKSNSDCNQLNQVATSYSNKQSQR